MTAAGILARAAGKESVMNGAVSLDIFFATPRASSSLVEGGISQIVEGGTLLRTGTGLIKGGLVTLAAQATFVGTYLLTSYAICKANPEY
jgi:hypothetical protein